MNCRYYPTKHAIERFSQEYCLYSNNLKSKYSTQDKITNLLTHSDLSSEQIIETKNQTIKIDVFEFERKYVSQSLS